MAGIIWKDDCVSSGLNDFGVVTLEDGRILIPDKCSLSLCLLKIYCVAKKPPWRSHTGHQVYACCSCYLAGFFDIFELLIALWAHVVGLTKAFLWPFENLRSNVLHAKDDLKWMAQGTHRSQKGHEYLDTRYSIPPAPGKLSIVW